MAGNLQLFEIERNTVAAPELLSRDYLALAALLAELHVPEHLWPYITACLALSEDRRDWFECADIRAGELMRSARTRETSERASIEARVRKARRQHSEWTMEYNIKPLVDSRQGERTSERPDRQAPTQVRVATLLDALHEIRDYVREQINECLDEDPKRAAQRKAQMIAARFRTERLALARPKAEVRTATRLKLVRTHAAKAMERSERRAVLLAANGEADEDVMAGFRTFFELAMERGMLAECLSTFDVAEVLASLPGVPESTPGPGVLNGHHEENNHTYMVSESVAVPGVPRSTPGAPAELAELRQWTARRGKVPVNPRTGRNASVGNSRTWGTYAEAVAAVERFEDVDGIGFVFTKASGIVGVDLDHCRDPETFVLEPWAQSVVDRLNSFTEVSLSGTGVHTYSRGGLPDGRRKSGRIEMYDSGRFFAFTGEHIDTTTYEVSERVGVLAELHAELLAEPAEADLPARRSDVVTLPSDNDLVRRLRAEDGDKAARLLDGDKEGYKSDSEADLALCSKIAFYTDDEAQVDGVFRASALYRPKWDEKRGARTYGEKTVARALARRSGSYGGKS